MKIKFSHWGGLLGVSLSRGGFEAVVLPEVGANVVSFQNAAAGYDILKTPPGAKELLARPQAFGIPILFPPNRISGGRFSMGGRDYSFPINSAHENHIHGMMLRARWQYKYQDECGAVFSYDFNPGEAAYSYFPHPFTAQLTVGLSGSSLSHTLAFSNTGDAPMPFGLGYHTAFNLPFAKGGAAEDCRMRVNVLKQFALGENGVPTGELYEPQGLNSLLTRGGRPLQSDMFDDHFTADRNLPNRAVITGGGHRVIYEADSSFSYWTLWNADARGGFVCAEPQTCAINAFNMENGGAFMLPPGALKKFATKITVLTGEDGAKS